MTANTPPKPHTEGMEWTNTETGIKYMFTNGAWRAVSSEASEEVADAISKLDLKKVCDNGYITDTPLAVETEKGVAVFTEQELRITHEDNPYIRLVDQSDGDSLEITLNDDHGHIDMSDETDELHFKFANIEKVSFKGTGDAEFLGRVKVQPGIEENEVVTYGQLATITEELEQLVPSLERGLWNYDGNDNYSRKGTYILIKEFLDEDDQEKLCDDALAECSKNCDPNDVPCLTDCTRAWDRCKSAITGGKWALTNKWAEVQTLGIAYEDARGTDHTFDNVKPGMIVDIFNVNDEGFMFAEIEKVNKGPDGLSLEFKLLRSAGEAKGPATIKFFELDDSVGGDDLTNFVRKDGDNMTGKLETTDRIWIRPKNKDGNVVGGAGAGNMLVVNQESDNGSIVRIQQNGTDVIKVEYDKNINLYSNPIKSPGNLVLPKNKEWTIGQEGNNVLHIYADASCKLKNLDTPTHYKDAANKDYADMQSHKPSPYAWRFVKGKTESNLAAGEFSGPDNPDWNSGKKHTWIFHKEAYNHNSMDFYKVGYHMYLKMGHMLASFWFDGGGEVWKTKGLFWVRDIWFGTSTNSDIFKIQSHTDFDDTENKKWPSQFTDRSTYYLKIAGLI